MVCSDQSDSELVSLARSGNSEAFGLLIERYSGMAKSVAVRMLASEDHASEVVQEAALQAFLSLGRLRKAESFRSWFYGIVVNLCRGFLRSPDRDWYSLDDPTNEWVMDSPALSTGPDSDPENQEEGREQFRQLVAAIHQLAPTHRETLLLYYFGHFSLEEIAVETGVKLHAVKVRLHRARKELRAYLQRAAPDLDWTVRSEQRRMTVVKVTIADVVKVDGKHVVVLQDEAGERLLPVWIGEFEAVSIALGSTGFPAPRPVTYTFVAQLIETLGARLEEVRVEALKEDTFYGVARLRRTGQTFELDARPSDMLALSVRTGAPIFVGEEVLKAAAISIAGRTGFQPGRGMQALQQEFRARWQKIRAAAAEEDRTQAENKLEAVLFEA